LQWAFSELIVTNAVHHKTKGIHIYRDYAEIRTLNTRPQEFNYVWMPTPPPPPPTHTHTDAHAHTQADRHDAQIRAFDTRPEEFDDVGVPE
jgi:hypothetical protein